MSKSTKPDIQIVATHRASPFHMPRSLTGTGVGALAADELEQLQSGDADVAGVEVRTKDAVVKIDFSTHRMTWQSKGGKGEVAI